MNQLVRRLKQVSAVAGPSKEASSALLRMDMWCAALQGLYMRWYRSVFIPIALNRCDISSLYETSVVAISALLHAPHIKHTLGLQAIDPLSKIFGSAVCGIGASWHSLFREVQDFRSNFKWRLLRQLVGNTLDSSCFQRAEFNTSIQLSLIVHPRA